MKLMLWSHELVPVLAFLVVCGCAADDTKGPLGSSSGKMSATRDSSEEISEVLTSSGPITTGMGTAFTATAADLDAAAYTEKEYFFEGAASAYMLPGTMTMDGKWTLEEQSRARFKSRLLVRRPSDAGKFNGTVVVEWLNVSGGADGDPGFMYNAEEILRGGYAWVGVSAQAVGIEGGGFSLGGSGAVPLKQYDPERYGSLVHPGDAYSYDIFSRAAEVIRGEGGLSVLDGLEPVRLIGYGESQSAMRMVSYVNGVHPLALQYDGFFIHSRGPSGTPFEEAGGLPGFGGGGAVFIRDDIAAKVFQFQTETDVTGMLAYLGARQPDSDKLRSWEVAGTAHADQHILDFNAANRGGSGLMCEGVNNGPQHFVIKAALHSLDAWMRAGTAPPRADGLTTDANGASVLDEHGNATGGVRTPSVDVPISTLSGSPAQTSLNAGGGNFFCFLFGSTTPFTPETLKMLYPTHDDYVTKVEAAASRAQNAGFLLEPEARAMVAEAKAAAIPN